MRLDEIFLNELSGVRSVLAEPINSPGELVAFMKTLGFQMLGGGEFSLVFENPSKGGMVVKVFDDECYEKFIGFCKANKGNPCLPVFHGNSVRLRNSVRMIRVERLTPMTREEVRAEGIYNLLKIAEQEANGDTDAAAMWTMEPEQEAFLDTARKLYAAKGLCLIDMHAGNVMRRGDQIVIIDPYAPNRDGWGSHH